MNRFLFVRPAFIDELIGRETFERFQPPTEIVGVDEVDEVAAKLVMAVVVIAFDGGFFGGAVHALNLAVGPGMIDLGEAMFDAILAASHVKHVGHVARC